jgi:putative transposase
MAEEDAGVPMNENVTTDAVVAPTDIKKQRASRRSKVALEGLAAQKAAAKTRKSLGKESATTGARFSKASAAETNMARLQNEGGGTSVENGEERDDLVQLEEENRQLRTSLADKLRAENASLRKRLGDEIDM